MAHNPFLSMGEAVAPIQTDPLNPFMMSDTEQTVFTGDNPFAASNPFSDFGSPFEPAPGDTVPMDIFGTMDNTISNSGAKHINDSAVEMDTNGPIDCFDSQVIDTTNRITKPTDLDLNTAHNNTNVINIFSDDEDSQKPKRPPPPARPLPPETQNLILTVTGQMDFTSSDLLDRIPPTRTPSPVSMRDIHSPSPTPDPDEDMSSSVNLFGDSNVITDAIAPAEVFDINQNKPARPARPPPARPQAPPARPAPPPVPPAPTVTQPFKQPPQQQYDDINLFDAPAPPVIKPTKEEILSLYSTPKKEEEKQIDFLSDDILDNVQSTNDLQSEQALLNETTPALSSAPLNSESHFEPTNSTSLEFNTTPQEHKADETSGPPMDFNISNESPFSEHVATPFPEKSPFDSGSESVTMLDGEQIQGDENNLRNPFECVGPAFDSVQEIENSSSIEPTPNIINKHNETDNWASASEPMVQDALVPQADDDFDAFSAKFDSTFSNQGQASSTTNAWGDDGVQNKTEMDAFGTTESAGFEAEAYDPFLTMSAPPPPPAATPRLSQQASRESNDDTFSPIYQIYFRRPKDGSEEVGNATVPVLAPPPPSNQRGQADASRFNPFDKSAVVGAPPDVKSPTEMTRQRSGSGGETPPTPLFDEDVSVPLEDFPRTKFWKKIFVRLTYQGDNPVVQLLNSANDKEPFQELPLQACYSVSEVGAQQFDQYGKIFTVKLQYVFYKERPGVRPGQVTKAERITNKLSQFAAYAIQGDYQGVKEFGSDLRKLGLPVEHAPQVSQLFKLGSLNYEDVKQFSMCVEEALFRLPAHRDRALTYKMEEVQLTAVDELYVEQDAEGCVLKQIARVRVFFLGFLSGMPDVELGVNDLRRQGKEVVGRHDIIPVVTEEWIRVEIPEFHACVQPEHFGNTQIIRHIFNLCADHGPFTAGHYPVHSPTGRFKPPDACYIELMRFRVRPPKNRELPLQLKAVWCVTGNKVELRADVLVPGFASRKLGQVPCEDVAIRFPIPECWIYLFRVEKHFRYGSVKSAHRRTGKIKGIERFLGTVETLQESLIEVTSGQAKYEHQHRAIVWRMPRLPKEGQGAYTTHNLVCRMALTSYDQVPEELARWANVEFTMPATQVSHVTIRSVSLQNHDSDPPEKYVRYLARHEYIVGIERTTGTAPAAYVAAVTVDAKPEPPPAPAPLPQPPSSDSDSD
ncbi:Protein stoned-B [Eumeta japonica]|uniref:Protein stoned-B n=1 Tax=Eumeta variegata TaxID=151549 RepID=A0A4C1U7L1_EUMVA|nr:Protein stoned-B [Eumeta japonica]